MCFQICSGVVFDVLESFGMRWQRSSHWRRSGRHLRLLWLDFWRHWRHMGGGRLNALGIDSLGGVGHNVGFS